MAFHLLTEDELDSIAHYYHQSTPGPWSDQYPANMNWDKEFLARPKQSPKRTGHSRRLSADEKLFLHSLMQTVEDLQQGPVLRSQSLPSPSSSHQAGSSSSSSSSGNPYAGLSDKERIRIKRRKVGKFIGLVGMETPVEEVAGRIEASLERAIERSREELRRNEEVMLRRRKMA